MRARGGLRHEEHKQQLRQGVLAECVRRAETVWLFFFQGVCVSFDGSFSVISFQVPDEGINHIDTIR